MGVPPQLPHGGSSSGHGPFGERAFRYALLGCVVLVFVGVLMVLLGGSAPGSVGAAFVALGMLGLITSGAGLLAERISGRRPPPPAEVRSGNGRGPRPPGPARRRRP